MQYFDHQTQNYLRSLGDALIDLILAENFAKHGHQVTVYHSILHHLNSLFSNITVKPFIATNKLSTLPEAEIYISGNDFTDYIDSDKRFIQLPNLAQKGLPKSAQLLSYCQNRFGSRNLSAMPTLNLSKEIKIGYYPKRVVIHPTSANPAKNWNKKKFIQLAELLETAGYQPLFTVGPSEYALWQNFLTQIGKSEWLPQTKSFLELSHKIAMSGYMIGNDSGIGHLASLLGLPTLTIFRKNDGRAQLWRPCWQINHIVSPKLSIITGNLWSYSLTARAVFQAFKQLKSHHKATMA